MVPQGSQSVSIATRTCADGQETRWCYADGAGQLATGGGTLAGRGRLRASQVPRGAWQASGCVRTLRPRSTPPAPFPLAGRC